MYRVLYALLIIIWILDVTNMPFMEFLDIAYPINTTAWFLIWTFVPSTEHIINKD